MDFMENDSVGEVLTSITIPEDQAHNLEQPFKKLKKYDKGGYMLAPFEKQLKEDLEEHTKFHIPIDMVQMHILHRLEKFPNV